MYLTLTLASIVQSLTPDSSRKYLHTYCANSGSSSDNIGEEFGLHFYRTERHGATSMFFTVIVVTTGFLGQHLGAASSIAASKLQSFQCCPELRSVSVSYFSFHFFFSII